MPSPRRSATTASDRSRQSSPTTSTATQPTIRRPATATTNSWREPPRSSTGNPTTAEELADRVRSPTFPSLYSISLMRSPFVWFFRRTTGSRTDAQRARAQPAARARSSVCPRRYGPAVFHVTEKLVPSEDSADGEAFTPPEEVTIVIV